MFEGADEYWEALEAAGISGADQLTEQYMMNCQLVEELKVGMENTFPGQEVEVKLKKFVDDD